MDVCWSLAPPYHDSINAIYECIDAGYECIDAGSALFIK